MALDILVTETIASYEHSYNGEGCGFCFMAFLTV